MRPVIILLLGISLALLAGRNLFKSKETKILRQLSYTLALMQAVLLVYILFLAMVQGSSL